MTYPRRDSNGGLLPPLRLSERPAFESTRRQVTKHYLRADLTIECNGETDPRYREVMFNSWIFIAVWPIGVPILYLLVLLPNRYAILQKRNTRLVRATSFL